VPSLPSEMTKEDLKKSLSDFFNECCYTCELAMAFLYGSWAAGSPREDSDIDIAVLFKDQTLSEEEAFNRIIALESDLSIKLRREVNILLLTRDFRKPMLYYNAIVQGDLVYARDFEDYVALSIEALFQMEDYSLFGIPWQIEMAKNGLEALKGA
jgi:predicted nucleotidyltransferase